MQIRKSRFLTQSPGGLLWLDLVNSEVMSHSGPIELLPSVKSFAELLGSRKDEIMGLPSEAAQSLLRAAHDLRTQLRALASRVEEGRPASARVVLTINRLLETEVQATRLIRSSSRYELRTERIGSAPERFLAEFAQSAAEFLVSGDYSRLRRCGNPACVIHFYDSTKNGGRKFCSPAVCGNRMKVAAHYRRKREAANLR